MFGNLFGKKEQSRFTDKTFLSSDAKHAAIIELCKEDVAVVFICWFPSTLEHLQKLFAVSGIDEGRVTLYRNFHATGNQKIYFAEHYPLSQKEEQLIAHWQQNTFIVFNALDEPMFRFFGSDKIIPLAKSLGMKYSEAIEHSYVTNSIKNAQKKIAEKVVFEKTANSPESWVEMNLKN